MKRILIVLITATLMLSFSNCKKNSDDGGGGGGVGGLTDSQKLTSKTWTSYKVLNSGTDVTSSSSTISFNFDGNGSYTATGFSGSSSGNWSLSGSTLNLGSAGTWAVKTLTTTELQIDNSNGAVVIYLH